MDFDWLMGLGGMDSANTNFDYLSALQDGGSGGIDSSNTNFDPNLLQSGQVNGGGGGGGADSSNMNFGNLPQLQASNPYGSLAGLGSTGAGAGGGANALSQFGGLQGLLTLLAPLLGGVMSSNASKDAASQQQAAAQKANDNALALMGGGAAAFKPYQDAGAAALGKAGGMNWSPLAGRFADVQAGPALGPQYQNTAALLGPRFSSPGPGRMATLAGLGGSKNG